MGWALAAGVGREAGGGGGVGGAVPARQDQPAGRARQRRQGGATQLHTRVQIAYRATFNAETKFLQAALMFRFSFINLRRDMKALINRSAQMQFDGYGVMMDKRRGLIRRPAFSST